MNITQYTDLLTDELRSLDVPGARIGQILAEVESHLAETGEDPVEAFGPVAEYARERAIAAGVAIPGGPPSANPLQGYAGGVRVSHWLLIASVLLFTMAAAWILLDGVLVLAAGGDTALFGLSPWAAIIIGAVLLGTWVGFVVWLARNDKITDPRTGGEVRWDARGRRRVD